MHDGGGMRDKHGRIVVNEKDCGKLWKEHMEKIMEGTNVENERDQMGKAAGPSKVNMDMIMTRGKLGVRIKKLCERILDGEDWPEEWNTSVVVPIFKGKRL